MRYLPVPVDLKKAEKNQCRQSEPSKSWKKSNVEKVDPQQVEQKTTSKKWTPQKIEKNYVEKVGL